MSAESQATPGSTPPVAPGASINEEVFYAGGPAKGDLITNLLFGLTLLAPLALQLHLAIQMRWWGITALLLLSRWAGGRWGPCIPLAWHRLVPLIWPVAGSKLSPVGSVALML